MTTNYKFDLGEIKNRSARQRLEQALEYRGNFTVWVSKQPDSVKDLLNKMISEQVDQFLDQMFRLAKSIDTFENNPLIQQDRRVIPNEIEDLKKRLAKEANPHKKLKLQDALNARQKLLENLQEIEEHTTQSHKKLTESLDQLRSFYLQALDLDARRNKS